MCVDELGYLAYDARAADLIFQLVSRRYEHRSLLITTNLPFKNWDTVFPNASCAVALIDRLTHHVEILRIEGRSFRRREAELSQQDRNRQRPARRRRHRMTRSAGSSTASRRHFRNDHFLELDNIEEVRRSHKRRSQELLRSIPVLPDVSQIAGDGVLIIAVQVGEHVAGNLTAPEVYGYPVYRMVALPCDGGEFSGFGLRPVNTVRSGRGSGCGLRTGAGHGNACRGHRR